MNKYPQIQIGDVFTRLTVISESLPIVVGNKKTKTWLCKCQCEIIVRDPNLKNGLTKSCGCLKREVSKINGKKTIKFAQEACRKQNRIEIFQDYIIVYATNTNNPIYIDKDDYDKIKKYTWSECPAYHYAKTSANNLVMHRLIMNAQPQQEVDHINHNRMDNRKNNLRIVTHKQNNQNRNLSKNYSYRKDKNKWKAYIKIDGKQIFLGYYNTEYEAHCVAWENRKKYFKEYAWDWNLSCDESWAKLHK